MHVHLTSDPTLSGYRGLEYTDNFWTVVGVANARKTLDAGFTTVRNVGSGNFDDVALKQGIEHRYVPGPRIVPTTYAIGATGGHCDATEFPPSITTPSPQIADSPQGFRAVVRRMRKYGAQVIKVCMTGGVLSKTDSVGAQQIGYDEIKAIVDEAHMLGMRVAVHAHGTAGINDALRAGVDTIEHASLMMAGLSGIASSTHDSRRVTPSTGWYHISGGRPGPSIWRCSCSDSVGISPLAMPSSPSAEGEQPRPCSRQAYWVGLILARLATSCRRNPGVRRLP